MPTCRKIKAIPFHEREHVFQFTRLRRTKKQSEIAAVHSKFLAAKRDRLSETSISY